LKKRIVILGAGESGIGTAILAQQKGYDVFVTDGGSIKENYRE
jgi:UDP-N-acetylmuramoylalanine--D-glutamate ligase